MKTKRQSFIIYLAILFAITSLSAAVSAGDRSKVDQGILDAKNESQIWTTYALSPYLRANNLQVSVKNGKAVLTGTVEDDVNKDLAKQIALGVSGINEVDNKIAVKAGYAPPKPKANERSYGQIIDDASITAAVKSKLLWGKNTSGMSVNVDTKSGHVVLQGTTDNGASKELSGRIASNTHGVLGVDNQLKINKENKPGIMENAKNTLDNIGDDVSDSWITTKVKSTYLYSSNVGSSNISVATKEGVVTLSGKVSSGAERELAVELANNVRGVKSVKAKDLSI
jgi:osmotically-inducible protein OsmY